MIFPHNNKGISLALSNAGSMPGIRAMLNSVDLWRFRHSAYSGRRRVLDLGITALVLCWARSTC